MKLGTITQDGNADVYSYDEDDMVLDPNLVKHLAVSSYYFYLYPVCALIFVFLCSLYCILPTQYYVISTFQHFGINVKVMEKTEKTMLELEIDYNQRAWEWSRLTESGTKLLPKFGPGYTGMFDCVLP